MYLVDIQTTGKYSGRRLIKSFRVINALKTRIEFPNGKTVTVEKIGIVEDMTDYSRCPKCQCLLDRHLDEPEYTAICLVCCSEIKIKKPKV